MNGATHCRQRRRLLRGASTAAALSSLGGFALSAADGADTVFTAQTFAEAIRRLGGAPAPSRLIVLDAPDVADNGAAVPITISSALPGTREILLLVDANPQPVAVSFTIPAGTEPFVATRIRMAASGTVVAAVRCDDGLYSAAHRVAVTVGGCG